MDSRRVAFIGLGIMGAPMASNLAGAGHEVTVWNRTRERAEALDDVAHVADSPADAADGADAVITVVPDAPQVESVLFEEGGATERAGRDTLFVDMSTVAPSASRRIGERLTQAGFRFLEAPVSGSKPKAESGTLTIMAAGETEDFERARPLFDAMGELIVHVGPLGHGQMAKVITNTMGAVNAAALGEALTLVRSAGLDTDAFLEVAGASAGGSTALQMKARPMLENDFSPLFKLEHMLKDVRHCLEEARLLGLEPRLAELASELYARAVSEGHGEEDFAAVVTAAEAASRD